MLKKTKLRIAAALFVVGVSTSAFAVWDNAMTIVYYTDSSMSEVAGYDMYYCTTVVRSRTGSVTSHSKTLVGGSCLDQGQGVPPSPY